MENTERDNLNEDTNMQYRWYRMLVWCLERSAIARWLGIMFLCFVHFCFCFTARVFVRKGRRKQFYEYYHGPD